MEEEKKDLQDPKLADDQTSENESENTESSVEDTAKELASFKAQKEHFRTKSQKLQEALDAANEKEVPKQEAPKLSDTDRFDILDFSIAHKEVNHEEVIKIQKYASALGLSMEDAYKDDFIMAGIEKRIKAEASEGADVNSNRSPRNKAKSVQYKSGMSRDEFKKLVESQ
jgi:hypothetical protein